MTEAAHPTPPRVVAPTDGRITSPYGPRRSRADGEIRMHNGVDFAGAEGRAIVRAVADGVVTHATRNGQAGFGGYGITVVVRHDDLDVWTLSAHLHDARVRVGQRVRAGDVLGTVGATNGATTHPHTTFRDGRHVNGQLGPPGGSGPHLHWEVMREQAYPVASSVPRLDPIAWLASHGVRYTRATAGGELVPAASSDSPPGDPSEPPAPPRRSNRDGFALVLVGLGFAAALAAWRS